jgi:hypothetical protein
MRPPWKNQAKIFPAADAGGSVSPLSESSARLGTGRVQQSETGIAVPGTCLSLAQSRRRADIHDLVIVFS